MHGASITNVPHVPRTRAFRDARAMIGNPLDVFERYRAEFGPTFSFHFGGAKPVLVSTSPDFIQHVLQRNSRNYHMSDIRVRRMAEFQGQGLLNSHGDAWLTKRRFLAQGFLRSRLVELLPFQTAVVEQTLASWDAELDQGPLDMYPALSRLTFRLVGQALFGAALRDEEITQLRGTILTVQHFMVRQIVQPYLIPWFRLRGESRRHQRLRAEGEAIVRAYIAARRSSPVYESHDLLQLLLHASEEERGGWTPEQILVEIMQLLVAGNETSPVTLSWAFYLLGRNPMVLEAMRAELDAVFGSGPITFEGLHQLRFTLSVLDEVMRLYPAFWMIDRFSLDDDEADGVRIPAGVTVVPYIYGVHRHAAQWEEPERFDPGRFNDAARKGRHPFAHLPFGGGPRKCIGSNLAMVQMLLVLASLLRRYDFVPASDQTVNVAPMMILHPREPILMHVRRRR
jgi:cytochrome P450